MLADMSTEVMKRCSKCREEKAMEEFHRVAGARDGHYAYCKPCASERNRRYHRENKEAIAERQLRYYEENAEALCEYSRRWRVENAEARAEYERRYRQENAEALAERQRRYCKEHAEAIAERQRRYNAAHKEVVADRKRRWAAANLDKRTEAEARRRARKLGVPSEAYTRAEVFAKTDSACYSCGVEITYARFVVDHVVPLQPQEGEEQGTDLLENLMPQCPSCSCRKSNRPPTEALFVELRDRRATDITHYTD